MAQMVHKHPFINGLPEIPEDKIEDVKKVRSWLKTQSHLPDLTDEHLFNFLHCNYYNVEKAQNTIESYFTIRAASPEVFTNRSPKGTDVQTAWDLMYMVPLPKTTPEGYKVIINRLQHSDASKFVHLDSIKAAILFSDIRLSEDGLVPGYVVVCDSKGMTMAHLTKTNLSILRLFLKYAQEAKPVRLKSLHIINSATIVEKLVAIAKPFMKSEIMKILHIHGNDLTNFYKTVPLEILPEDYGGKEESLAVLHERNRKMMEEKYEKWVEEEDWYIKESIKKQEINKKAKSNLTNIKNLAID